MTKALHAAGKLALAADAVLRADDDAFGRLRRALDAYNREIIKLARKRGRR